MKPGSVVCVIVIELVRIAQVTLTAVAISLLTILLVGGKMLLFYQTLHCVVTFDSFHRHHPARHHPIEAGYGSWWLEADSGEHAYKTRRCTTVTQPRRYFTTDGCLIVCAHYARFRPCGLTCYGAVIAPFTEALADTTVHISVRVLRIGIDTPGVSTMEDEGRGW